MLDCQRPFWKRYQKGLPEPSNTYQAPAITSVVACAAAGIKPGDAIIEVARRPVSDPAAFKQIVAALRPGESVPVYLQRGGGRNEYVMLTAPPP